MMSCYSILRNTAAVGPSPAAPLGSPLGCSSGSLVTINSGASPRLGFAAGSVDLMSALP